MINNLYLIDKSNDFPPEPGQIQRSDVKSVQHDYTTGWVVETLQQGRNSGFSLNAFD